MRCTKCGSEIAENMKFCTNCGAPAPVSSAQRGASVCASCGAALVPGVKFCTGCGAPVGAGSTPAPAGKVCSSCGARIAAGIKFCTECGAPVSDSGSVSGGAVCRSCGAKIMPGVKFCTECGTPVSEDRISVDIDPPEQTCKCCGAKLLPGRKFCTECGAVVTGGSGTDSISPGPRALVLVRQDCPEIRYEISIQDGDDFTVGRLGTDILIADDPEVSRLHCRIYLKNGEIYIADAGSRNGTIYKGRRLAAGEEYQLSQTGILRLGKYTYRLTIEPRVLKD